MSRTPSGYTEERGTRAGRRLALSAVGALLVAGVVWYAIPGGAAGSGVAAVDHEPQTVARGCGPAALMAVAAARGPDAASRVWAVLEGDPSAAHPVSSLYDLATWAKRADLEPVGLKVTRQALSRVPLPAIVHVQPDHFLALVAVSDERAVVIDQGRVKREIPRRDFDRRFSGYVLCFKRFLERRG